MALIFVAAAGCDGAPDELTCLRSLDADEIVRAQGASGVVLGRTIFASVEYAPNVDGALLLGDPLDRIVSGDAPDRPLMIGSNANEADPFTLLTAIPTQLAYRNAINDIFGPDAAASLALYPASDFGGPKRAYNALLSDVLIVCPTVAVAEAASSGQPSYLYHFTHSLAGLLGLLGSPHALDLVFVFGNFPELYSPVAEDLALVGSMQRAWTEFAHGNRPITSPPWPPYDADAPGIALLDEPVVIAGEIRDGRCAELREIGVVP